MAHSGSHAPNDPLQYENSPHAFFLRWANISKENPGPRLNSCELEGGALVAPPNTAVPSPTSTPLETDTPPPTLLDTPRTRSRRLNRAVTSNAPAIVVATSSTAIVSPIPLPGSTHHTEDSSHSCSSLTSYPRAPTRRYTATPSIAVEPTPAPSPTQYCSSPPTSNKDCNNTPPQLPTFRILLQEPPEEVPHLAPLRSRFHGLHEEGGYDFIHFNSSTSYSEPYKESINKPPVDKPDVDEPAYTTPVQVPFIYRRDRICKYPYPPMEYSIATCQEGAMMFYYLAKSIKAWIEVPHISLGCFPMEAPHIPAFQQLMKDFKTLLKVSEELTSQSQIEPFMEKFEKLCNYVRRHFCVYRNDDSSTLEKLFDCKESYEVHQAWDIYTVNGANKHMFTNEHLSGWLPLLKKHIGRNSRICNHF